MGGGGGAKIISAQLISRARSGKFPTAGIQGPRAYNGHGPGSSRILDVLLLMIERLLAPSGSDNAIRYFPIPRA